MDTKNRQQAISKILMKAWRERWTDYEFGINIKKALPIIRLPTDAANLCDMIIEQTLLGAGVNKLLLSYLKHSLHSHLVSYPAVIKRITQYNHFDRFFCIRALLDFIISIIGGVTCRSKAEESALMTACMSLVLWLIEMTEKFLSNSGEQDYAEEQNQCLEKVAELSRSIVQNQFLMGVLYLAKLEDREVYEKCFKGYKRIHGWNEFEAVKDIYQMIFVKFEHMAMKELEPRSVETISFCLQPFMSIEVLVNASAETSVHVSKFLMIQKLKKYSMARLYCEIIRSCLITLCNVREVNYRLWAAFYLYKVPLILKQLHLSQAKSGDEKSDNSDDIVEAFNLLMESTPILDQLDTVFQCNTIKIILEELMKQNLINEENCGKIREKRKFQSSSLEDSNIPCTPPPIDGFIKTIDPLLNALITSLREPVSADMLTILSHMLIDNRDFLLYTVASVKGKHRTMVNGMLKCNDSCKENVSDAAKSKIRSNIFDVSFISLFSIIQKCGVENFPELTGDLFFEKWAREAMFDSSNSKSPMCIVKSCDQSKVEEIIAYFSDANSQAPIGFKPGDICLNIPAMLYQVIIAWENETIAPTVVKNIINNMRVKMCCFAVVAASWLTGYMNILLEDEKVKPRLILAQLMKPLDEQITKLDAHPEKFSYTQEIIVKLHETQTSFESNNNKPLKELFNEQWNEIVDKQWMPFDVAIGLEQQFKSCSAFWLMKNLVDELLKCKSVKEMEATSDIVFAIMHLNIESCTEALLRRILPIMFSNKRECSKLTEPQSRVLAKLCVYAILSTIETTETSRKRQREDDDDLSPAAKMRKTAIDQNASGGIDSGPVEKDNTAQLKESLRTSLQDLFKIFHQQVCVDELSPHINFIFQFFSLMVQLEKSVKLKPILKLIPNGLIMNLLKIVPEEDLTYGFVLRLYDLSVSSGRSSAISELCLLRNIFIRQNSVKI